MPKSKSVRKATRVSEQKRLRNKSIRSNTKTSIAKAEDLILSKDLEAAQPAVVTAVSAIDKAAKRKIIHPNTAARRKSRLVRKLNQATLASVAEPKMADTDTTED